MDEDIREMIRSFRNEADVNARLNQQKYDRRERRYDGGVRASKHTRGRNRSISDNGMRDERYYPAPEPGPYDTQDPGNPYLRPGRFQRPTEFYTAPERLQAEDEFVGDDFENGGYDAGGPPGQYRNFPPEARANHPSPGRGRQAPVGRPRRREQRRSSGESGGL
ncbi:MAG: hypothetical protein Q9166_002989 [cf. Caloplaca sp. 2 TL-2023]